MKILKSSELILENDQIKENKMIVFPDGDSKKDLVGFQISYKDRILPLCDLIVKDYSQTYFHLDKFNLGCLIDYLKRIYDNMGNKSNIKHFR